MYQIVQFLRFYLNSFSKYRIHSPFVFTLIENVIEDDRWFYAFDEIELRRKMLQKRNQEIVKNDKGAGSSILKKKDTFVSLKDILKTSVSSPYKGRVLYRLVEYLKLKNGIELGTSAGISAAYLAKACSAGKLFTIEANKELCAVAKVLHRSLKIKNCEIINLEFQPALIKLLPKISSLDYVFIDGDHSFEATTRNFNMILPYTRYNTIIIIDDIYWSEDMTRAWDEIKSYKSVRLSIDLFYFGLIFLSNNFKEKQHFIVKSPLYKYLF